MLRGFVIGLLLLLGVVALSLRGNTATLSAKKHGQIDLKRSACVADTVIALWPDDRFPCANELTSEEWTDEQMGLMQIKIHRPELHVFRPFGAGKKDQAVMICPGGGYYLHAWEWEGAAVARAFNQRGITAAVLKYRLPHWETEDCRSQVALADAQRGMQLLRHLAETENFDPAKIGIMGFSAGGHLAASASVYTLAADPGHKEDKVARQSSRPDFSILVYPVISMDTLGTGHAGSRRNLIGRSPSDEMVKYFSLEKQVNERTPPTILFHAADDGVVPVRNSLDYFSALNAAKVPASLRVYAKGGHGFSFANAFTGDVSNWWQSLLRWLEDL
ncbi:esterase [Lewinellaceae bacterium SD302]|nr:esterase [Lewinellaceae bacterium SD302]